MIDRNGLELGPKMRELRRRAGFTASESLARKTGVSRNTVDAYERGERLPEIDFLAAFADVTNSDLAELIRLRLASGPMAERRPVHELINERIARFNVGERRADYPHGGLTAARGKPSQSERPTEVDWALAARCFDALVRTERWAKASDDDRAQGLAALYDLARFTGRPPAECLPERQGEAWGESSDSRSETGPQ